jgi:hypothetical protein
MQHDLVHPHRLPPATRAFWRAHKRKACALHPWREDHAERHGAERCHLRNLGPWVAPPPEQQVHPRCIAESRYGPRVVEVCLQQHDACVKRDAEVLRQREDAPAEGPDGDRERELARARGGGHRAVRAVAAEERAGDVAHVAAGKDDRVVDEGLVAGLGVDAKGGQVPPDEAQGAYVNRPAVVPAALVLRFGGVLVFESFFCFFLNARF